MVELHILLHLLVVLLHVVLILKEYIMLYLVQQEID